MALQRVPFSKYLVDNGFVSKEQLDEALKVQKRAVSTLKISIRP